MTNFERLAAVRAGWPEFLLAVYDAGQQYPGGRVVYTSRSETPPCDPIALRDGVLTVAARREGDESLVERDLGQIAAAVWERAFGPNVVRSVRVIARDQAVFVLADEMVLLGTQVQRLLHHRRDATG